MVTNTMFSDMRPWQKQDQNSDFSLTSKVKLPALPHALRVKGTRRGSFTPSDLSFHADRLYFPMASAGPHIAFPGRDISSTSPWACALIFSRRQGKGLSDFLRLCQPSDTAAPIRLPFPVTPMSPSKLPGTYSTPTLYGRGKSRLMRHKWGVVSSQVCSESSFFSST